MQRRRVALYYSQLAEDFQLVPQCIIPCILRPSAVMSRLDGRAIMNNG